MTCLESVLSVWVFIVVTVRICSIGCVSVSIVRNGIPLTVPRGISPPFRCSTADLNITAAVVDAGNTVVVSNQGGRSGAAALDFLIQDLDRGIWEILTNTLAVSKSAVCAQPSMVLQDIWRRGKGGREASGKWGVQSGQSQDCAVSPVWFGPSTEPAGLIRT